MKMKIAKGILYVGVIGLAIICIVAIIDTYNLAIIQGLTSSISCYDTESFDAALDRVKPIQQCDEYNPQFIFFAAMGLLVADAFLFHFFNRIVSQNAQVGRAFEKELKEFNIEPQGQEIEEEITDNSNKHEERQIQHRHKKMWT